MKKVVRLNENDIEKLVRKIILENEDSNSTKEEEGEEIFKLIKNNKIKPTGSEGIFRFEYNKSNFVIYPEKKGKNILLPFTDYIFKKDGEKFNIDKDLTNKIYKYLYNLKESVMIRENENGQSKEKSLVLLKTNNGELSTIDNIINTIRQAESMFQDLCTNVTGSDGYADEIDGIRQNFLKLQKNLLDSKETVGKFVQQKNKQDHMAHMKQKQMDHMRKRKEAYMSGKNYSY